MTILVCAATRAELGACVRGIRSSRAPGKRFATMLSGVGPLHAARNLEQHLARSPRPSFIVSSGFAGGVAPHVAVGDWVTAAAIRSLEESGRVDLPVALRAAPRPAIACTLVSSGTLVLALEQSSGNEGAADAIDMESAALAGVATRHGLMLMVLRLVSDTREQPLPSFLSPFSAAMAAADTRSKLAHAARGLRRAIGDPRGVARVVRDGGRLCGDLADGWEHFAHVMA